MPTVEYKAHPEGYIYFVVFGGDDYVQAAADQRIDNAITKIVFKTQEELYAYMLGIEHMEGYSDYKAYYTLKQARERVLEISPDSACSTCQNCRKVWKGKDLKQVLDPHERLAPDDETDGECPECHALCYQEDDSEEQYDKQEAAKTKAADA